MPYRLMIVHDDDRSSYWLADYASIRNADRRAARAKVGHRVYLVLVERKTGHTIKVY